MTRLFAFVLQQDCPNGRLTPAKFVDMYKMFFPSGNAEEFCDHVFRTFDMDKNGYIDFKVSHRDFSRTALMSRVMAILSPRRSPSGVAAVERGGRNVCAMFSSVTRRSRSSARLNAIARNEIRATSNCFGEKLRVKRHNTSIGIALVRRENIPFARI